MFQRDLEGLGPLRCRVDHLLPQEGVSGLFSGASVHEVDWVISTFRSRACGGSSSPCHECSAVRSSDMIRALKILREGRVTYPALVYFFLKLWPFATLLVLSCPLTLEPSTVNC
jgi:hypothetical protein